MGQWERVFVLGDTSYGSCCVDEVAAQHLAADCIVHYGRTCLSATTKIPVIYVFGNARIQVDDCVQRLSETIDDVELTKTVVLLYEPCYHHATSTVFERLVTKFGQRNLVFGTMKTIYDPANVEEEVMDASESPPTTMLYIGGQKIILEGEKTEITPEAYTLLYIGTESAHLSGILMRYSNVECFSYNPKTMSTQKEGAAINRALMRRYYLVQQAKEAQIYGILMGTLGVKRYLDIQNTLMDSKEFYKPIVTPYELQLALSRREEWDGRYKTDFGEVIPALEHTAQDVEQAASNGDDDGGEKPFFSLVSGTYQVPLRSKENHRKAASEVLTACKESHALTTLQDKNEGKELTTYRSEAAEYFATREYQGLDPRIGETAAHAAVHGSSGIAMGYAHELQS
ncbi:hypothetical protein PsorP6_008953 [Peronosclerospora sorghi]|uniref:Uncharacterized protein n=1 Tax=Peronosclerospora sorghi TaxID=230839 RepID=A0ACC0W2E7_9STRA|nr:hypothetical protein PsorP6_008953 [Peronosclerospora sorghi]